MVPDKRNTHSIGPRNRTRHDVGLWPVHPHEVDVDRGEAVKAGAPVAGERHRFEKDFGEHDRGPAIDIDAALQTATRGEIRVGRS